ncbi:hypothetical protein DBR06_SOUSAS33710064, partial [Sousa chinensis]
RHIPLSRLMKAYFE